MKQLKFLSIVLLATLFSVSIVAQEKPKEVPNSFPAEMNQPYVSPDTVAKRQTNELSVELGLTEKQYKKVYKLLLKQEKQRRENMYAHLAPKRDGAPARIGNGQRPQRGPGGPGMGTHPGGLGGGRPGMIGNGSMSPPPNSDLNQNLAKKHKNEQEKFLKNMKKVLSDAQYAKWMALSSKRPPIPGKPKDNIH